MAQTRQIDGLQYFRAIAAILVLFYHTSLIFSRGTPIFGANLSEGRSGVDLFFVLSGFVIMHAHASDIGRPARLRNFIVKRVVRIYPAATIATVLTALLYLLGSSAGEDKFALYPIIASFLLLPQAGFPMLNVTWTLVFEMFYYAIFALWIVNIYLGTAVTALWAACVLAMSAQLIDMPVPINTFFQPIVVNFAIGVLVYHAANWKLSPRAGKAILAAGIALFAALLTARTALGILPTVARGADWIAFGLDTVWIDVATYGVTSGIIVLGIVHCGRLPTWRTGLFLGEASYAIYLVHRPVLIVLDKVADRLGLSGSTAIACLALLGSLLAGCAFHHFVDRHIQRFAKARLSSKPRGLVADASPRPVAD